MPRTWCSPCVKLSVRQKLLPSRSVPTQVILCAGSANVHGIHNPVSVHQPSMKRMHKTFSVIRGFLHLYPAPDSLCNFAPIILRSSTLFIYFALMDLSKRCLTSVDSTSNVFQMLCGLVTNYEHQSTNIANGSWPFLLESLAKLA